MKMNHCFSATLFAIVFALNGFAIPAAFSQDKAKPGNSEKIGEPDEAKIKAALGKLSEADRSAAAALRYCPMMDTVRLGAMGTPVKAIIDGQTIFVCCSDCKDEAEEHGKATLAKVEKLKKAAAAIAKLPAADQKLAEAQLFCPIAEKSRLGSMGAPVKLMLEGKPVFLCCKGCEDGARKNAKKTLAKVEEIKKANASPHDGHDHEHEKETTSKK